LLPTEDTAKRVERGKGEGGGGKEKRAVKRGEGKRKSSPNLESSYYVRSRERKRGGEAREGGKTGKGFCHRSTVNFLSPAQHGREAAEERKKKKKGGG